MKNHHKMTNPSAQAQTLQPLPTGTKQTFEAVIKQALQNDGFYLTSNGIVSHLQFGDFPSWAHAAIGCIKIAIQTVT
jgi:hypothetical protein